MKKVLLNLYKIFMNTISINGKKTHVTGKNIVQINNKIWVDGVLVASDLTGKVQIEFTGDVATLKCDYAEVNGNITGKIDTVHLHTTGNITGDVNATHVNCNNITGDVEAVHVNADKIIRGEVKATHIN